MESKDNCITDPDIIEASRPFLIHQVIATIAFLVISVLLKLMSDEMSVKTTVIYEDLLKDDCLSTTLHDLHVAFLISAGIMLTGLVIALIMRFSTEIRSDSNLSPSKAIKGVIVFLYIMAVAVSADPVYMTILVMTREPEITALEISDKDFESARRGPTLYYYVVIGYGEELTVPRSIYNSIDPGSSYYLISYNGHIVKAYDCSVYTLKYDPSDN